MLPELSVLLSKATPMGQRDSQLRSAPWPPSRPRAHLQTPPGLGLQAPGTEEPLSSGPLTATAPSEVSETFPSCPPAGPGTRGTLQ